MNRGGDQNEQKMSCTATVNKQKSYVAFDYTLHGYRAIYELYFCLKRVENTRAHLKYVMHV